MILGVQVMELTTSGAWGGSSGWRQHSVPRLQSQLGWPISFSWLRSTLKRPTHAEAWLHLASISTTEGQEDCLICHSRGSESCRGNGSSLLPAYSALFSFLQFQLIKSTFLKQQLDQTARKRKTHQVWGHLLKREPQTLNCSVLVISDSEGENSSVL